MVNTSALTDRFMWHCCGNLNNYLIIEEEEPALLQLGGHYYCLLNGLCIHNLKPVVSESMWVEIVMITNKLSLD